MKTLKKKYIRLTAKDRLHQCPNPIVGLTGGIATGKSTVSQLFKDHGLYVICADELIHKLYQEEATLNKVKELCPQSLTGEKIDFKSLRKSFFSDPKIKSELEKFLYAELPRVFKLSLPEDTKQVIIYDVPLLFEKKLDPLFDQIIAVITHEKIQLERLMQRDGRDEETHRKVLAAQWPLSQKKANSDFVLENNGTLGELEKRVLHLTTELFE